MLDAELVERARGGDDDAFGELVGRHEAVVLRLCQRVVGDATEARDVCQEVFVAAWKGLARFRGDSSVSTWLHRIAVNQSMQRRRGLGRFRRILRRLAGSGEEVTPGSTAERPLLAAPEAGPVASPEDDAILSERRAMLDRALAAFSEEMQVALHLADREGRSYEEIGEVFAWPLGTVKSRIHRAREQLAKNIRARIREGGAQ